MELKAATGFNPGASAGARAVVADAAKQRPVTSGPPNATSKLAQRPRMRPNSFVPEATPRVHGGSGARCHVQSPCRPARVRDDHDKRSLSWAPSRRLARRAHRQGEGTRALRRFAQFFRCALIPAVFRSPTLASSPFLSKGASLKRRLVTWGGVQMLPTVRTHVLSVRLGPATCWNAGCEERAETSVVCQKSCAGRSMGRTTKINSAAHPPPRPLRVNTRGPNQK
jgi:hypothetical protein